MRPTAFRVPRRLRLMLALAPICFLGAMVAAPSAQARENYALIVAATKYSNLDQKYWLEGPANDAVLVRDFLLHNAPVPFEPQNVETLATADGLQDPTHANIIAALDGIAAKAQQGDFVYLHFSGHGSYQPAVNDPSEPDGRDEVFLPSDTAMATDGTNFLPNALTDDDVKSELDKIRDKGAFVWVVFDSCHSGTMTRGVAEDGDPVERKIEPEDLGIPESAFPPATAEDDAQRAVPVAASALASAEAGTDAPNKGGLVAFFAAQSTETTSEKNLPIEENGTTVQRKYGIFTFNLLTTLARNPNITYRQLAQSVLQNYAANNINKPTPLFEGKLDAPVFGSDAVASAEQWPTQANPDGTFSISAGQLHGLGDGTRLLVLPNPTADDDQAIGVMEVASLSTLRSTLKPVADETHPLLAADAVPKGAYVRLTERNVDFELAVARPEGNGPDAQIVDAALDAIEAETEKADRTLPLRLRLVDPGQPADVRLAVLSPNQVAAISRTAAQPPDDTPVLWLLPSNGEVSLTPGSASPRMKLPTASASDDFTKQLAGNLVTIFRATGLSRLAQSSTFKPTDFSLDFVLQSAGSAETVPMPAGDTPIVRSGDRLHVQLTNNSGKPLDFNVLYIDHDYGISMICSTQLAPGDRLFAPMADLGDSDKGAERIVAVLNEAGKDVTDLSYLAQGGIASGTRGPGDVGLLGQLHDLGAGEGGTRGPTLVTTKVSTQPRGAVVMVPLEVLPATGAEAAATIELSNKAEQVGICNKQEV